LTLGRHSLLDLEIAAEHGSDPAVLRESAERPEVTIAWLKAASTPRSRHTLYLGVATVEARVPSPLLVIPSGEELPCCCVEPGDQELPLPEPVFDL